MQEKDETRTRTTSTEAAYLKRYRLLCQQRDRVAPGLSMVEYLASRGATLSDATLRQYRAAVVFGLALEGHHEDLASLESIRTPGLPKRSILSRRTSAQKQKHLSEQDEDLLITRLSERRCETASLAMLLLRAGIVAGLRPGEWVHATLEETILRVRNAKHTNGRAHGEFRTINLGRSTEVDLACVRTLVSVARGEPEAWDRKLQACSKLIQRVSRELWPRRKLHPTLYSARHQFAANAKASVSKIEVAALMGHANDLTAKKFYGRRDKARSGFAAQANPAEALRVRAYEPGPSADPAGPKILGG